VKLGAIDPNPMVQQPSSVIQQPQELPVSIQIPEPDVAREEYVPKPLEKLHGYIDSVNIAEGLEEEFLNTLAAKVVREFEIDEGSREEWKKNTDKAMKVARQVIEEKNTPWAGAANVKYPLITIAGIQFASRAYAEIIKGNDVVKCKIKGEDPTGEKFKIGTKVAHHMSWQFTEEMEDWEEDTDKLLHVLPIVGFLYRKTYYSPILQRNVSEMVLPDVAVCHYKTKNLQTCRRFTEIQTYFKNDIQEFVSSGQWIDPKIETLVSDPEHPEDDDPPYEFLEQHRYIDLDDDGYAEPYIVTVHKQGLKTVRIVARFDEKGIITDGKRVIKIVADQYYTKIPFIPAPDGSFYDIGFGVLLNAINESVNTLINQLLDSGTLSNTSGGFIANGIQLGKGKTGGTVTFKPGEWKQVMASGGNLKDSFFAVPVRDPSAVLFQLLGMLIEAGKDMSSTQDIMLGKAPPANTPAATSMGMIEQGQQAHSAIHKRIYRAFKREFKRIFALNVKYGQPKVEFNFKDEGETVFDRDYKHGGFDIVPVMDPELSSDMQRIARAQASMQVSGRLHVKEDALTELFLEAVNPENKARIMMNDEEKLKAMPPLPILQLQLEQEKLKVLQAELQIEATKIQAQTHKFEADAILALARAKDIGDSDSVERLEMFLKGLDAERARQHQMEVQQQQAAAQAEQVKMQQKGAPGK
jgi:chaperonin GroES